MKFKGLQQKLFIFTTFREGQDNDLNNITYATLWKSLQDCGHIPMLVNGCYKGVKEKSIGVWAYPEFEDIVKDICLTHKQESYLVVESDIDTLFGTITDSKSGCGLARSFIPVSKEIAEKSEGYSEIDGVYYVLK